MEYLGRIVLLVAGCSFAVTGGRIRNAEGTCEKTISDFRIILDDGQNYTHRCDFYECVNGNLTEEIHKCEKNLTYTKHGLCHQWSSDGCCCDVVGCVDVHGEVQPEGAWFQVSNSTDPTRPKCGLFCKCDVGPPVCRRNPLSCLIVPAPQPPPPG